MTGFVAAILAASAVLFLAPARPGVGLRRSSARPREMPDAPSADRSPLRRLRPLLVAMTFASGWTVLGGVVGVIGGGIAAAFAWRVLGNAEDPWARRRRRELEEDLPVAVQLLGACLDAGAALEPALDTVARALGGTAGAELLAIRARLVLGGDPVEVWREAGRQGPLAPLGRRLARAHESGASVTSAVGHLCEQLRGASRKRTEARARSVEVRAAVPLGICLLPAFLLLGVVPMSAGIVGSIEVL